MATQAAWAVGALWLAAVTWAFLNGPRLHAAQEQEAALAAEAETRRVCERLLMPPGSAGYPACAAELGGVRWHQTLRLEGQSAHLP